MNSAFVDEKRERNYYLSGPSKNFLGLIVPTTVLICNLEIHPLEHIPTFAREGSIIPIGPDRRGLQFLGCLFPADRIFVILLADGPFPAGRGWVSTILRHHVRRI